MSRNVSLSGLLMGSDFFTSSLLSFPSSLSLTDSDLMGRIVNLPCGAGARFTGSPARAGSVYLRPSQPLGVKIQGLWATKRF